MKKYLVLFVTVFFIVSCNSNNKNKTTEKADKPADKKETVQENNISKPIYINDEQFRQKIHDYVNAREWKYLGDKPCIVDFYADWCAPCRRLSPILEQLAQEYGNKIYIYKVNTEYNQNLAAYFNVRSIPAVMLCPMNSQPQMMVGLYPIEEYRRAIQQVLNITL